MNQPNKNKKKNLKQEPNVIKKDNILSINKLRNIEDEIIYKDSETNGYKNNKNEYVYKNEKGIYEKYIPKKQPTITQRKDSSLTKYYEDKAKDEQLEKDIIKKLDVTTDVMQAGKFVPHPIFQTIGNVGSMLGAGVDLYQGYNNLQNKDYSNAAINIGSSLLPLYLNNKTFLRNTKYSSFAPELNKVFGDYGRTNYLNLLNRVRKQSPEQLFFNRAAFTTLGAETINDAQDEQNKFYNGGNLKQQNNNNMLTEFNEGGKHEENPYGGIPQGSSSNGQMNTVEQGETKKGNFVYSDRLYINEDLAKQMNLPNYIKGKTFANASKSINNKFKDRNDIHTKATQKELLDRLANAQEYLKQQEASINESMKANMLEPEYPNNKNFDDGGFMNFIKNNSSSLSDLGTMINPNGYNGNDIKKANENGFENTHLQNSNNYIEGLNNIQGAVAKSFGPVGDAVFGGKKFLENATSFLGDNTGSIAKSIISPEKAAITNLTDKNLNISEKMLGMIPGVSGLISKKSADKKLSNFLDTKKRVDNFYKYQFNENNNNVKVFAGGGKLNNNPFLPKQSTINDDPNYNFISDPRWEAGKNALDFINEINNRNKISEINLEDQLANNPDFIPPNIDFKNPILKSNSNTKKIDYKNIFNKVNNSLRYAPILGNILQKNKIGPAEVEKALKNPYEYSKQTMDVNSLENIASQQANNTNEILAKSGLTGNQLLSAMLGSQLNKTKAVSDAYQQVNQHNINENKLAEQVRQQNESDYINDSRYVRETNAQNRANRDTQISKFNSEIYNALGDIGKENTFKKQAEKLTGYSWMGDYLMSNPEYKSQFDAIEKDPSLDDKTKYAKKQLLIQQIYKGMTPEQFEIYNNIEKEVANMGHEKEKKKYGGYLTPKFKKY